MRRNLFLLKAMLNFCIACVVISCSNKEELPAAAYKLSYGDSILYLQNTSGDYIVHPAVAKQGNYYGFPEGIEIDNATGAINVSKSETGLRYRITYVSPKGDSSSTMVVLSGITFKDHYYHLSTGDSIANPVYNALETRSVPLSGSNFDEGSGANSGGCSVKTNNGTINLAQTARNGVFGNTPQNDVRRDFDIQYRLNDGSNKSLNKLRVRLYWYNTMADVPTDLLQTLSDREAQGVFLRTAQVNGSPAQARTTALAKPRPPCVIIIAQ
jgi:hypothetical protein